MFAASVPPGRGLASIEVMFPAVREALPPVYDVLKIRVGSRKREPLLVVSVKVTESLIGDPVFEVGFVVALNEKSLGLIPKP